MPTSHGGFTRRSFLKRAGAVSLGTIAARGVYDLLDEMAGTPARAAAAGATVRRRQEQYLVDSVEVILDNGVTCAIPPVHNDVITAKLKGPNWTVSALKSAQARLENALATVERPYPSTAAGLTMVVGWGLPYFRDRACFPPALWQSKLPVDKALSAQTGTTQYAVLDAIRFPSDPADVLLEDNHVMFKLRSDSSDILRNVEGALFDNPNSGAYIGDLFDLTSKRIGFLGRGFISGSMSVGKQLALAAGVPGADQIPDRAQLMLGFTSTQTGALGPDNIPSFETLPGVTNQFPSGYFAGGCAMHLSHLFEDLDQWYGSNYASRVGKMFSSYATVPADSNTVTLPNGPSEVVTKGQLLAEAGAGQVGHNSPLQQATRLGADVTDNYGRLRKKGTAVPLREDFNTIDNPFAWSASPAIDRWDPTGPAAAGLHFVAFVPASSKFHAARLSMDGVLPDGTNLRTSYNLTDANIGINAAIRASHRQNYLIPPRAHRSFPLVELMK
jgi:hypothetical protein